MDDVNDMIQESYIELLKILQKNKMPEIQNIDTYLFGIANNVIKRHYQKKKKENVVSFYFDREEESKIEVKDDFDLEQSIITKENVAKIWEYVKQRDMEIAKIFYLYFALDLKIGEIAKELEITESKVKNKIYRTLKELKKYLGKDVINDGKSNF